VAPVPPDAPSSPAIEDHAEAADEADTATETARLEILRALERGEIDIELATQRLAALDGQADG